MAENKFHSDLPRKVLIIFFKMQPTQFDGTEVGGQIIERVQSAKILGVSIRDDLLWTDHVDIITRKASKRLYLLQQPLKTCRE